MNIQGWSLLGLTGLISLQSRDSSRVFSSTTIRKHQFFGTQPSLYLSHLNMTTGKTIALTMWTFVCKVISLLFNKPSRFIIAFLPRSKHLFISWLQSKSTMILEPKKIKYAPVATFPPFICHEVMGLDAMILGFWMMSFKSAFSLSSFTIIKRLFSSSPLSAIRVVSSAYLRLLIFLSLDSSLWFIQPGISQDGILLSN